MVLKCVPMKTPGFCTQPKLMVIVWFAGPYTTSRLEDIPYKTQDSTIPDTRNRSKCRTHE